MKIKNEYVEIKVGNKVYTKQNMILNTYLKAIIDKQLNQDMYLRYLGYCYIKLDTPIENVNYDSNISANEYDIRIVETIKPKIIATEKNIKVFYNFEDRTFMYKKSDGTGVGVSNGNFDIFSGRKVVGIGFGNGVLTYAYLDTRNMNIVINEKEQFRITRLDNFVCDGIAKGIEYPLHLVNDIANKDEKWKEIDEGGRIINTKEITKAKLYSVGFGNKVGYMEEEYLIEDVETARDDYSITFNVSRIKKEGHYPSEDLHFTFYPTMDNSKYIIFKYRLYRIYLDDFSDEPIITDLNEYYTMSKPNENFGNLEIKLKIER